MPNTTPIFPLPSGISGLAAALRVAEPLLLAFMSVVAFMLRNYPQTFDGQYAVLTLAAVCSYAAMAAVLGLYKGDNVRNVLLATPRLAGALLAAFGMVIVVLFLYKTSSNFSRAWMLMWVTGGSAMMFGLRAWASYYCAARQTKGLWSRKLAVLGTGAKTHHLLRQFENSSSSDVRLVGVYARHADDVSPDMKRLPLYRGTLDKLVKDGRKDFFDDLIIAEDLENLQNADKLLNTLHPLPANIYYCLPTVLFGRSSHTQHTIYQMPLVLLLRRPMEGTAKALKRALDVAATLAVLIPAAPVMLGVAAAVKLSSPGPVLFRQKRHGFNNQEFEMLKFRSMRVGASATTDSSGKEQQATQTDPRITAVGRFIRKTSLDELPQLINVLRGDMSLVGPRPHAISHNTYYEQLIDRYTSRHKIRPGLTGWAQLNGLRGETETVEKMAKRVEYDIWYTENWSLMLDLRILIMTPLVLLFQKSAY